MENLFILENFLYYKKNNRYILQISTEMDSNMVSTRIIATQLVFAIKRAKKFNLLEEKYLKNIYTSLIEIGFYTDNLEKDIYDKVFYFDDKKLFDVFIDWLNSYLLALNLII